VIITSSSRTHILLTVSALITGLDPVIHVFDDSAGTRIAGPSLTKSGHDEDVDPALADR
jgi:hypothetical protein